MAINNPTGGPNSVPAYQLSGVPYITSSVAGEAPATNATPLTPIKHEFPYVTRFFQIECTNSTHDLRVGFSASGSIGDSHYFVVEAGKKSDVYELRTKDLFFISDATTASDFRIIAGLTSIPRSQFPILTGSVNGTSAFKGIG